MNIPQTNKEGQSVQGVNALLDEVILQNALKNDAKLSYYLHVAPPVISKLRHGILPMGPSMILRLHEFCGMDVANIREVLKGDEK